ncbi:unnamed protein product, partial [Symbiodinium sp. KB8]
DLTFLSESDPALTFEPAPAGAQYSMGELLRMVEDEESIDPQQLWMLSTHMRSERGGDWHMARVENLTWRLRNMWSKLGQEAKRKALVEQLLKILEKWGLACPVGFGGSDLGFAAFGGHEVW